jgi:L,D-peptidoglycan transpeptidase YkuD (ErfK/YbiS/YcfS/YnhG family)
MIKADRRVQGSGTTPAGVFPLRGAFGLAPDPGSLLPYTHVVAPDIWWVTDPISPYYNTLRAEDKGGFSLAESGNRASIRIAAHPMRYEYALVIDFNRPKPVRNRGAGIFVQVSTGTATAGSVSIDREALLELLRWLDPAQHPVVAIAPEREMAQY